MAVNFWQFCQLDLFGQIVLARLFLRILHSSSLLVTADAWLVLHANGTTKTPSNPWLIAIAVTLAAFMEVLDTTIVNVALPHIAGSPSSSSDEATWALTSYLVANGIVLTTARRAR